MKNFSLKVKILLTIVSLTILSLGIFSYLSFSSYKKDKLAFVYDHLASEAQSDSMLIKSTIESYDFFLSTIVQGISANSSQLNSQTGKFLDTKPQLQGIYYHVPEKKQLSRLTLYQSPTLESSVFNWERLLQGQEGFSFVDRHTGLFLWKRSLSVEKGMAAVLFRSPELADAIRSGAGRFGFLMKGEEILSKDDLQLDQEAISSIRSSLSKMRTSFGLFEVKISGDKYFAAFSRLPFGEMVLLNLIQERKVLLIQEVFTKQVILFLVLMGSIALLVGTLSSRWLTIQLDDLTQAAQEIESGNFNHQIQINSKDEFGMLGQAFNSMSGKIGQLLDELRLYNTELEAMVEKRTQELRDLSNIQNAMLNSLGQGFVIIDRNHEVLPIYSKVAVEMFDTIPDQASPEEILGIKSEEAQTYRQFFDLVFNQAIEFDVLEQMNPEQRSNSKNQKIFLNYSSIINEQTGELEYVMVIGTDKTAEIESMEKLKKEWNFSQMITKAVSNRYSLNKVISESMNMLDESLEILESEKPHGVRDIQRAVHTVKGSFSYFNIPEITQLAHDFEQYLEPFYNMEKMDGSLRSTALERISALQVAIECYIDRYDSIIQYRGSKKTKLIPVQNLEKFSGVLRGYGKELLDQFRDHFYFFEIRPFFQMYPNLINDLEVKLGKKMEFRLSCSQETLPEGPWEELFGQFIHFIRNSADHGIESESERIAAGKNPVGEIKFEFDVKGDELEIRLADDGRGVDWKKIALKDPSVQCEKDALERIISGGISSKDSVSEISGRGVGVSAIFAAARKWGGEISLLNEVGKGMGILIKIPLKKSHHLKKVA